VRSKMKKIVVGFLLLVMLFPIVGCSSAQPEDTVHNYFDAAQKINFGAMSRLIAPTNTEDIERNTTLIEGQQDDPFGFLLDYMKSAASKITYKLVESTINGDSAVVTVDCKYVDSGPILTATIGELFVRMFEQAFNDVEMTEEEKDEIFSTVFQEQIKIFDETFKEVTLNIDLVKIKDTWYVAETSDELLDVVMSGFISAENDISDSFSSNDAEENSVDAPGEEISPTNTPRSTSTPNPPTATPEPTPQPSTDDLWAINYDGYQESGPITIEIGRIVVGKTSVMPIDFSAFQWDTDVVGEIIFIVRNDGDKTVNVYPLMEGTLQIGGEQIELWEYS